MLQGGAQGVVVAALVVPAEGVAEAMVVEAMEDGLAEHQQDPRMEAPTIVNSVRSATSLIMMLSNAGIALIKPIRQKILSNKQPQQLMGILSTQIGMWIQGQLITSQATWSASLPKRSTQALIRFK
jgi:hypothetical protein